MAPTWVGPGLLSSTRGANFGRPVLFSVLMITPCLQRLVVRSIFEVLLCRSIFEFFRECFRAPNFFGVFLFESLENFGFIGFALFYCFNYSEKHLNT